MRVKLLIWLSCLCCSNGVNVEGAEHRYVVELIKQGGDVLKLTVISVSRKVRPRPPLCPSA